MSGAEPLRAQEREVISRELGRDKSARFIGKLLGRPHSTIAREIERNGAPANTERSPPKSVTTSTRCDRKSGSW
jgi:IS30 family transposase